MACRVGMSTNPDERIAFWKKEEGHKYSQILASKLTYDQATRREKSEAEARGCKYGSGGPRESGSVYSVYHVWGGK